MGSQNTSTFEKVPRNSIQLFHESVKKNRKGSITMIELKIEKLETIEAFDIWYDIGYGIGAAIHDIMHLIAG